MTWFAVIDFMGGGSLSKGSKILESITGYL